MGSHLFDAAETARVAAGGALAVDRDAFSTAATKMVENHPNITVERAAKKRPSTKARPCSLPAR